MNAIVNKTYRKYFANRYDELKDLGFCEEAVIDILSEEMKAVILDDDKKIDQDINWPDLAKKYVGYFYPQ